MHFTFFLYKRGATNHAWRCSIYNDRRSRKSLVRGRTELAVNYALHHFILTGNPNKWRKAYSIERGKNNTCTHVQISSSVREESPGNQPFKKKKKKESPRNRDRSPQVNERNYVGCVS
jgi:hypothetical protein